MLKIGRNRSITKGLNLTSKNDVRVSKKMHDYTHACIIVVVLPTYLLNLTYYINIK